jgi:hypothetical protein
MTESERNTPPFIVYGIDVGMYRQSGAEATVKAISIGRLLFSLLKIPRDYTLFSSRPAESMVIELYEGFVAGKWKLPRDENDHPNAHVWDASTMAVAFLYARREGPMQKYSMIHAPDSCRVPFLSHWKTIIGSTGLHTKYCDTDCMVVGIDSECKKTRQAIVDY